MLGGRRTNKWGPRRDKGEVTGDFGENDLRGLMGPKPGRSGRSQTAEPTREPEAVCCRWNGCKAAGRQAAMMDGGGEATAGPPTAPHPMSKIWDLRQWEEIAEGF